MSLKADELKSVRSALKKTLKGRPLYFGLMAPSRKKGKFRVTRKKGDVKPAEFKKNYQPYEDSKENNVQGTACMGVCSGKDGVLTLQVQGKAPPAAVGFLEYFIQREVRFKQVKEVKIAEVESLPDVPELSREELQKRHKELMRRAAPDDEQIQARLEAAAMQFARDLDRAEQLLDEAEELIEQASPSAAESDVDQPAAPSVAIDADALQKRLVAAKQNVDALAPKYRTEVDQKLKDAVQKLSEWNAKNGDAQLLNAIQGSADEIEDMIDGAYQDFFLNWLKSLAELQSKGVTNEGVHAALNATKAAIRNRNWKDATALSQETEKRLKTLTKAPKSVAGQAADKAAAARRQQPQGDESPLDARAVYKTWDDARRAAQDGLDELARTLNNSREERIRAVAVRGLAELAKRIDLCDRKLNLQAALLRLELVPIDSRGAARDQVLGTLAAYQSQLVEDRTVKEAMQLVKTNPFGVKLDLRAKLVRALVDIRSQVQAVAGS